MLKRILALLLILVMTLTVANASVNVKMDIYPSNDVVDNGESFLVFGYIYGDEKVYADDLNLKVYDDNGDVVDTYEPTFVPRYGDEPSSIGYFYRTISISPTGEYDIRLKIDGVTKATDDVKVKNLGERQVDVMLADSQVYGNEIRFEVRVTNNDDYSHDVKVYIKGDNNWNSPKTFTVDVDAGDTEYVTKRYPVSDFGEGNFIVACQAKADDSDYEAYSAADYDFVEAYVSDYVNDNDYTYNYYYPSYGYGNLAITDIELSQSIFYAGDVIDGYAYIKNVGSQESQYRFEYIIDNQLFKNGDVGYVQGYYTKTETFSFEVPDTDIFTITTKVISGSQTVTKQKVFMVSERMKSFRLYPESPVKTMEAGTEGSLILNIRNVGNEPDTYQLDVDGWEYYTANTTMSLEPGKSGNFTIAFKVSNETYADTYPVVLSVCNTNNACKTKDIELVVTKPESAQSEVIWDGNLTHQFFEENETLTYAFTITNLENNDKGYVIALDSTADYTIENTNITVAPGETKQVEFTISPADDQNQTALLAVYSAGNKIFEKELALEYTTDKEAALSGMTGMFFGFTGGIYLPGLVALAVIGAGTLVYMVQAWVRKLVWTEQVISYNKEKQLRSKPTNYDYYRYPQTNYPTQQTQAGYDQDTFMRRL